MIVCQNKNMPIIKSAKNKNTYQSFSNSSITCYRCGRDGHKSPDCYAKTDIDGDYID